jgi:hypothetical protein
MGFPKKIKKHLPLSPEKILFERREELLDMINKDGTYLPKSLLHADLDRGFLDFVKEDLKCVVEGKIVPTVDIIITTQNWAQFVETWNFQNLDKNAEPPFITTIRIPEVKYGTNPAVLYNIPNRRQYFYASVPTWDGQRKGMDVYKIPQPVPVDITYQVKIVCNRMRELNKFNQIILEKFASRQAYRNIKGHYIPIVMNEISDESVMEVEKRKYYIQSYGFTMLGFLIDEDEFEVSPGISRVLQLLEVDPGNKRKKRLEKKPENTNKFNISFDYLGTATTFTNTFRYTANIKLLNVINIDSFNVYINNNFYGSNLFELQINDSDIVRIDIVKDFANNDSQIKMESTLL